MLVAKGHFSLVGLENIQNPATVEMNSKLVAKEMYIVQRSLELMSGSNY